MASLFVGATRSRTSMALDDCVVFIGAVIVVVSFGILAPEFFFVGVRTVTFVACHSRLLATRLCVFICKTPIQQQKLTIFTPEKSMKWSIKQMDKQKEV